MGGLLETRARYARRLVGAVAWLLAAAMPEHMVAQAPTGSIRGAVTAETGIPVGRARVLIGARTTQTDSAGRFNSTNLAPGTYSVTVTAVGYGRHSETLAVSAGQTAVLNVRLVAAAAHLAPVVVSGSREATAPVLTLPSIQNAVIVGAKKNEVVNVAATPANLAENNARQVFARVPGITVWELDGNGLQTNIAARGLNPHRSWEFLVAENGRHVNSDLYGYPEAHYNPPMQAVDRVEVVRGTGALAFGPQFGGMVNYVLKRGNETRRAALETSVGIGSDGLFSSYNAVGGQIGRLNHYSYLDYRRRDGWRANSDYDWWAAHSGAEFEITPALRVGGEVSWMYYVVQFAGGLNDAQFHADAQQATRGRNFFSPNMTMPSLSLSWDATPTLQLDVRASGVSGERNSVQFIANPDVRDTINPVLGTYNPRVVDRDYYTGGALEARVRNTFTALARDQVLTAGVKLFDEKTQRRQRGVGTTGSDFDLALSRPGYPTDLAYLTRSAALFVEQAFSPTDRLLVTGGARLEIIDTHFHGAIDAKQYDDASTRRRRTVPLFGAGLQYGATDALSLYAGWSGAFRPVLYSDLIPSGTVARVDSSLRDASGWNAEVGAKGDIGRFGRFDVTAFALRYPNRIGTVAVASGTPQAYVLRTNVGSSLARGVESYVEIRPLAVATTSRALDLNVFSAVAFDRARYEDGSVPAGAGANVSNRSIAGNQVEGAPAWVVRSGITLAARRASITLQHNSVSQTFGDAINSAASGNGITGPVPGYQVFDLLGSYDRGRIKLRAGVSNLANALYFTRRTAQYPGPGIIPSDGRTFFLSVARSAR